MLIQEIGWALCVVESTDKKLNLLLKDIEVLANLNLELK
jgi:hypothetical protein